jgi:hypothetical protein
MKQRLAWVLWSSTIVLAAAQVALLVMARHVRASPGFGFPGFLAILAIVFGTVGAVVASRQPRNAIGWIFVGVGLLAGIQGVGFAYALNGILGPRAPWPAAAVGAWLNAWIWFPAVMVGTAFVFMLFPNGRLLSRRWRTAGWIAGAVIAVTSALIALTPGPLENFESTTNPFAVQSNAVRSLAELGFTVVNLVVLLGIGALVVRYRRSDRTGREQIKWIAYAGAVAAVALPAGDLIVGVGADARHVGLVKIADVLVILSFVFVPISIGIAILRYRLYDIDRIISRTVSYALVTGILVGAYIGLVVLFQQATRPLTGSSDLAVAASTLIVAAAFVPLRRRVQNAVDHRFNRARYDAAQTIEAFSSRLRGQVDLESLREDITGVVARTMQPDHVFLWLRGPSP